MTKGKPWTNEQKKKLRELVDSKVSIESICAQLGMSEQAVNIKIGRLHLQVEVGHTLRARSTSTLVIPNELYSIEEALKMLTAALPNYHERQASSLVGCCYGHPYGTLNNFS